MEVNKQRHIIKKQIIELNLSSQQGAFELQNEVSRIYRWKVVPLIDNLLSQFSDSETIHRINILEINLGNIDINHLERELIDKILEQIKRQLAEKFSRSSSSLSAQLQPNVENQLASVNATRNQIPYDQIETLDIANKRASQLEILSYFIQTGMLPWWSKKLSKQDLEKYCDRLITTSPDQVKSIIQQSLKNIQQLQRLIYQFPDAILIKIAGLFTRDLVQFIADYNTDIKPVLEQLEQTRNIPEAKLRLQRWQGILFSLSSNSNIKVNKLRLIQDNLVHIATSNGINYPEFLTNLVAKIEQIIREGKKIKSTLPEILEEIKILSQDPQFIIEEEQAKLQIASKRASQQEILSYFIQTGQLPSSAAQLSQQELEEYCENLITTSPNQVKSIIQQSLKNIQQLQRLIYQFPDAILIKIAGLFTRDLIQFIADYNTEIKAIF